MQSEGNSGLMQRMQAKLMEFVDPNQSQEVRLKAGHDIIDHIESIGSDRDYEKFLQELIDHINKILSSLQPAFLQEMPQHQIRKYCFEILHKVPNVSEVLRPYIRPILVLLMKAVEYENEENTLICLKTIVEYQKLYRPQYSPEVSTFIRFVREVYRELQNQTAKIFEPKGAFTVADLAELNLDTAILDIFTTTPIQVKKEDGGCSQCNLLPKSCYSLKVLQEIPILVVLMYQMYKQQIHAEISDLIPLICAFINLQPSEELRLRPDFNREVYVDFVAAQIKTLSFLAYIIRIYQEQISTLHRELVSGVLSLLKNCPKEVAHMRKELFIAVRHIFSTDIRKKFVSVMDQLCDETILIGDGYTMREALRPLAYSTIADVVHHIRGDLSMRLMALAVNLFGRNVDDETLPHTIQLMSLKLLLHLVECIRIRCDQESNPQGRLLILKIMNICINKCKAVAKYHLPALIAKCKREEDDKPVAPSKSDPDVKEEKKDIKLEDAATSSSTANKDDKSKKHLVYLQWNPYSLPECRNVVKTLICGLKSGSFAFVQCKSSENVPPKQLTSKDVRVYIRLFKYAIMCMDVYMISQKDGDLYLRPAVVTSVKMKEEKDNLEHLAGIFPMISQTSFREILEDTIDLFIDRMKKNLAVQFMANSFLANVMTSSTFATILLDRLLLNMKEIGEDSDDANMYLKLYKLAFGSVSLLPTENEVMLQPYLSRIVMQSVEYCLTANEPNNYLLLLRALFRSIGGGSHERLYREFLPLLPTFLRSLNKLLSAPAKKNMRDLFVDLCLIVPVRLSSLLPHLGLLMEPLVAALNGSQVFQGLRTLELCVDNLQDEFLAQQAPSLRFEMLQGLWKAIRDPNESNSTLALRLLGKLGGTNRQSLHMPQKLEVVQCRAEEGPTALIQLMGDDANMAGIKLPLARLVRTAHDCLLGIRAVDDKEADHYKRLAWQMLQAYVAGLLENGDQRQLEALMSHSAFRDHPIGGGDMTSSSSFSSPMSARLELERSVAVDALTGVFLSLAEPTLRAESAPFVATVVRQLSLVCLSQQAGPAAVALHDQEPKDGATRTYLDPHVLVDALCRATSSLADKDAIARIAASLDIVLESLLSVVGTMERLAQLEMVNYLADKVRELLYEDTWCHKWSACVFLERLLPIMPVAWVRQHALNLLRGLLYEVVHLDGLISQGCFPKAAGVLEILVRRVMTASPSSVDQEMFSLSSYGVKIGMETEEEEEEALHESKSGVGYQLTAEFTASLVSENPRVAEECRRMLRLLSELRGNKPLRDLLKPHRGVLEDLLPPKNFLIRQRIVSQQRAIMDVNYFFASQNPPLVRYDPELEHHKRFVEELRSILTASKEDLRRLPCYSTEDNLISLRRAACRVLSTCHYLGGEDQANIFGALFTAMRAEEEELSREGFEGLKVYADHCRVEIDILHRNVKPMLSQIRTWELIQVRDLRNLKDCAQIFPTTFSERLCESLQNHFRPMSDELMKKYVNSPAEIVKQRMPKYLELCSHLIDVFHIVPSASAKYVESMSRLVFNVERSLNMDATSALRLPLLRFLLRYPRYTLTQFLTSNSWLHDQHVQRFTIYCVNHQLGEPFRKYLRENTNILLDLLRLPNLGQDANFMAVKLIRILAKNNVSWFVHSPDLITALMKYWESPELIRKHQSLDQMDFMHWNEQQLILKCFILYFDHNRDTWDVLISMLRVLQTCSVGTLQSFQFVKDYLLKLARDSNVEWKRRLFHIFVDSYCRVDSPRFSDKATRARIILYLIIPSFHFAFENGDKELLMGGPPNPEQETLSGVPLEPDLANVFVNQVLNPEIKEELDCVRISQLHLACLLVDYASEYIHAGGTKRQGNLLRRLMTYAWPCLQQGVQCVDPLVKYHGHLLLVHIINRFAIHKKIVVQVFHSLLKASAAEGRKAVNPALDILVPIMNVRMEDDNQMLLHWTKKIFTEDSQAQQQCSHLMNLVVRQADVFFPVRHSLVPNLLSAMTRWCMQVTTHYENKKLLNDLFDTIIKWEKRQLAAVNTSEDQKPDDAPPAQINVTGLIDKNHREQLLNLVIRFIIQTVDGSLAANPTSSNSDHLARQAFHLLENALKTKVWPDLELRLTSFDRYLAMPDNPNSSQTALLTTLEVLRLLLQHMDGPSIQTNMRFISKGLIGCVKSTANQRCIRACAPIVTRIFTLFPPEPPNNQRIIMIGELSEFYQAVLKAITDAFTQYERCSSATSTPATSHLYSAICLLKATQVESNYSFLDRVLTQFCRVLYKMKSDVVSGGTSDAANTYIVDMLISALEMVKGRFNVMSVDMRKNLIQQVILSLIDKSSENKLIRAIIGLTKEWVSMTRPEEVNLVPYPREKSQLFSKLYLNLHRWEDPDIRKEFLETVYLVYVNDAYKTTDLIAKLESHFCMGLCSHVPDLRQRFTDLFIGQSTLKSSGSSMRSRILFLVSCVRWDQACFNEYYWIPICNQVLLHGAAEEHGVEFTTDCALIPPADRVTLFAEPVEQKALHQAALVKAEPMDTDEASESIEFPSVQRFLSSSTAVPPGELKPQPVILMIRRHAANFSKMKQEVSSSSLVHALRQFCYISAEVAHDLFLDLLPAAWSMMDIDGQRFCAVQARRFIASGIHTGQSDIQPTPLSTFTQALMKCDGFPAMVPFPVFHYIAANFNAWHPVALLFEQFYSSPPVRTLDTSLPVGLGGPSLGGNSSSQGSRGSASSSGADVDPAADLFPQDWLEGLIMLYDQMKEDDYMTALWARRTSLKDLSAGLVFAQQGQFDQAKEAGERLMSVKPSSQKEIRAKDIYMEHYLKYLKQLNFWEVLTKMGSGINALDLAEAYFMKQNYLEMTKALASAEGELSRSDSWRLSLLKGFSALTNPANKRSSASADADYPLTGAPAPAASASVVDRHIRYASTHLIKEWKHLPVLVSSLHLPLLRAAQQITEVQEAASVVTGNAGVAAGAATSQPGVRTGAEKNVLQDLRNLTKAWRHRMPLTSDNTAFWFMIFNWRFQVLQMVTQNLVPQAFSETKIRNHVISVFTSEMHTAWLNMAKAARKHNLQLVSLELLERMYSMGDTSLAYERFKQELKCRMEVSGNKREEYIEMMDFMEKVNIANFTREEKAEFFSFKGVLLARVHKGDEANRNFSYSVQLNDDGYRLWTHYGDFVESIFKDHSPSQKRDTMIKSGRHAAYCFTEAVKICRTEESKARRHIAKCFWLLCWDDAQGALARVLDERSSQIPPEFLLPWVPTLVACLLRSDGSKLMNILLNLVKEFPLAVYLPVKCLFQQLNREGGNKRARVATGDEGQTAAENRTSAALWRCSNILQKTRELHPSLVNLQDQLCEQLVWIGGLSWPEEALVQLHACLKHTLQAAHEASGMEGKLDRPVPPQLAARLHKMLTDFGGVSQNSEGLSSDSERRRAEAEADASYRSLKKSLMSDFEQASVSTVRTVLSKLSAKWIRTMTARVKLLRRRVLLDSDRTRLLLEYSSCSAAGLGELPLPGEVTSHLATKHQARIGSVCPWVERVLVNGCPARRVTLVTTTGRRLRYLLQGSGGALYESWREVRITQLFRTVNTLLLKNRETARRFLQLHVPRVMDVSAGCRLVEEGEHSVSLWQVFESAVPERELYKPLHVYFERLGDVKDLREVFQLVQAGVDKGILRRWVHDRLPDAAHFWHFRKAFTHHLALLFLAEHALFLTSMPPESLVIEVNTGRCHVNFFKFCVNDKTGEVEGSRPVPSRLTPNLYELITGWGVSGPLVASIIAAARCLDNPRHQFAAYLRASLRDEYIVSHRLRTLRGSSGQVAEMDLDSGTIVHLVVKAVQMISSRLHNLSLIDACGESKAANVVQSAFSVDNLALMDPSWHPWL